MGARIIDLSVPLENDVAADPPGRGPKIEYYAHGDLIPVLQGHFPGLKREDLPDGEGWAIERVYLSTHNGTHLDAPWHYASTMDRGKPAATIDEIPLDWCYRPGVKLDFRSLPDGHVVSAAEVEAELARIGHELEPLDIVVVNTAAGWSWDAPFVRTAQRYAATKDPSIIWKGHKAGREIGYCHIEKLHNLEVLPATGFLVACFPVKIRRASAGWTRAVAILNE
jgi:kynurenine formamidase